MVATLLVPGCLGCHPQEALLPLRPVQTLGRSARSKTSRDSDRSYHPDHRLSHLEERSGLPRTRRELLRADQQEPASALLRETVTKTRLEGDSRTSHRRGLTNHFRRSRIIRDSPTADHLRYGDIAPTTRDLFEGANIPFRA